ncbi:poly-beta-hydroxybutyrate polymerase [Halorhodospira abdelmalekii]|uniref:PHA/PHB synthase family protein n=1 Tax=Halorhodospira abdelmalekii TaxID=421629 RepID=UPI001905AB2B|nr:alpha/beta fold hydrolase [Halorhodospira abdelmalekii]MBK1735549.1 poly-beta-hydroxybutyrate polymerase [Halorhodospira abdelmalekii]
MVYSLITEPQERERHANTADRLATAALGRFTMGLSPAALSLSVMDWAIHLAAHPGKQRALADQAVRSLFRYQTYAVSRLTGTCSEPCIQPAPGDKRFAAEQWQQLPYDLLHQAFLLQQEWWDAATRNVRGVKTDNENVVNFLSRQALDLYSPANYIATNPEILEQTLREGGANLARGCANALEDAERTISGRAPVGAEKWRVGENLACSPGKVVYRNRIMELIQYEPNTKTVYPEPILIVPAWIMKYYILDLRPGKSLVEYLVEKGHTVFAISWKNPGAEDRDLGMDNYRREGIMDALDAISAIVPERPVHPVGYCLGGTLLMLAAATMARDGDQRFASMTLLAAQADFSEPGELELFIDESQVTFLEDMMWEKGYLDGKMMAGAFQLLRSNDLIYSRLIHDYLMGQRSDVIDLMAWNADTTRLPYRMHSEYLRRLFLNNDFVEDRYDVGGQPIHVGDIQVPTFAVGTEKDHIAPWRSVYKINRSLPRADVTFALTAGGHNAGIVTPPDHPRRTYRVLARQAADPYLSPDLFLSQSEQKKGSWWQEWETWLRERSSARVAPPSLGDMAAGYPALADAPGTYVLQK